MEIRYGAWSAILSGAAGHSYGGGHVWWAHLPESPASQGSWPLDRSFDTNTLDYPGARSLSFMAKFLRSIPWWKLEPHPELVLDYPQPLASAVPGQEYLVYARYGGRLRLDLRPSSTSDEFRFVWIDLAASKEARGGTVSGGAIRSFYAPESYPDHLECGDWLLHVRRGG